MGSNGNCGICMHQTDRQTVSVRHPLGGFPNKTFTRDHYCLALHVCVCVCVMCCLQFTTGRFTTCGVFTSAGKSISIFCIIDLSSAESVKYVQSKTD